LDVLTNGHWSSTRWTGGGSRARTAPCSSSSSAIRLTPSSASTNLLALGTIHALREEGLRIPDDIAVVGFDDIEESRYSTPPLTTISPDEAAIAREAVARLAARLDSSGDWERKEVTIGYTLEVRASSGG